MGTGVRSNSAQWLWVALFVAVTLALLAGGYAYYHFETERIRQAKYQELAAIGELKAGQIQEWRQERLKDLWRSSKAPFFRKAVQEWLRDRNNTALQTEMQYRLALEQKEEGYADALLFDIEGNILLSANPQPHPLTPAPKQVLDEALSKRTGLLSDLYRCPKGTVHLDAVAPIMDQEGRPMAVLVLRSNAESYLYPLIQSWPTPSRTAETLLVRKDGDDVLFLNDLRHRPDSALSLRQSLTLSRLPAAQAVLGRQGIFHGTDYRGVEVLADLRAIPQSPWFMVAKVDASEILAEARYRGGVTALFSVLFILLAAGVTAYAYRHRQVRLYRNLYRSERERRATQEEFRTTLYSIGDAVITTDTEGLVKQTNQVAERLTGWLETEARGKPLDHVFHIVNEDSRNEVENPVSRVLREGTVVGLANHTVLIAKDGTESPISDSGAPIRDESGAISGVVLVFRDQTEERQAQRALQENEKRYRDLWEKAPVMMVSLDAQARIIYASDRFCEDLGYDRDEVLGRRPFEFQTEDSARYAQSSVFPAFLKTGQVKDEPLQFVKKSGEVIDVLLSVTAERDAQGQIVRSRSVFIDVTERKLSEKALQESEARFSQSFKNNPAWLAIVHMGTHKVLEVNDAWTRIFGYTRNEAIGRTTVELGIYDDQTYRKIMAEAKSKGSVRNVEVTIETRTGENRVLLVSREVIEIRDEPCLLAMGLDITDRKRALEALRVSEEKFSKAFRNSPDIITIARLTDGKFIDVNERFVQISGYNREEALGRTTIELGMWSNPADRERYVATLREKGRVSNFETTYTGKSGEMRSYLVSGECIEIDGEPCILGILHDITERKRTEAALQASEAQLSNALEMAHLGHWEYDVTKDLFTFNDQFYKIFRATAEQVGGYTMSSADYARRFVHPDDISVVADETRKAIESNDPDFNRRLEHRMLYADGEIGHISVRFFVVKDNSGRTVRTYGVNQDITDRKLAEGLVRQAEQRYRRLFEDAPIMYVITRNEHGVPFINDCNELFLRAVGYSRVEVVGRPLGDFYSPESRSDLLEGGGYARALAGGFFMGERQLLTRDGQPIPTLLYTATEVDPSGQVIGTRAMFVDITERREAEAALRFEREQLLSIFESINEVILAIDPKTYEILYANKFTEDLYGKALVGGNCFEKLNGFRSPCEHCLNEKVVELKGKPYQWEYHSALLERDFLATDRMIRWPDGREVKLQLAIDITERNRAEQERERLSSQLLQAQKMEAVGTLAGGVAHDFNNLLQVVLGYSELILDDKQLPALYRSDLEKMNQAAKNGADLVQRLLTFSRKTEVKPRPLNLNRRIEQLQKMLSRTIPKMIEIVLVLAGDLATINADPTQMEQILMNLTVNARDAMPEGGKLIIQTENVKLDQHYCNTHLEAKPGPYVLLSVSDTGQGMDKETVQHIFEPFFTTKGPSEGTGLGLAMVYGIVKHHGGHIMCYSEPSQGTIFKMYFPALAPGGEMRETEAKALPRGGSETILIVDDEELIRDLGARILTKAGYKVITASNGKKALELYQENRDEISLVILDLIMPEMDGKRCLEELVEINPGAKVLIASGYALHDSTRETVDIGARGFVNKPYDVRQLLEKVRTVLDS